MPDCKHVYKIAYAPNSCRLTGNHCPHQNEEESCKQYKAAGDGIS